MDDGSSRQAHQSTSAGNNGAKAPPEKENDPHALTANTVSDNESQDLFRDTGDEEEQASNDIRSVATGILPQIIVNTASNQSLQNSLQTFTQSSKVKRPSKKTIRHLKKKVKAVEADVKAKTDQYGKLEETLKDIVSKLPIFDSMDASIKEMKAENKRRTVQADKLAPYAQLSTRLEKMVQDFFGKNPRKSAEAGPSSSKKDQQDLPANETLEIDSDDDDNSTKVKSKVVSFDKDTQRGRNTYAGRKEQNQRKKSGSGVNDADATKNAAYYEKRNKAVMLEAKKANKKVAKANRKSSPEAEEVASSSSNCAPNSSSRETPGTSSKSTSSEVLKQKKASEILNKRRHHKTSEDSDDDFQEPQLKRVARKFASKTPKPSCSKVTIEEPRVARQVAKKFALQNPKPSSKSVEEDTSPPASPTGHQGKKFATKTANNKKFLQMLRDAEKEEDAEEQVATPEDTGSSTTSDTDEEVTKNESGSEDSD